MPPKKTTTAAAAKPAAKKTSGAAKPKAAGGAAKKPVAAAAPAKKAETKPVLKPVKREFMDVGLKQIKPMLIVESDNGILKSGKAALLCDPSTRALTLMRYGEDVVLIDAFDPSPLEAEKLRHSLLFALRWGRTIVLNMEENDMTDVINDAFERVNPGLWAKIQDRSITKVDNIKPLLRDTDAQEFKTEYQYLDENLEKFRCILYTSSDNPKDNLKDNFFLVHVQ